MTFYVDGVAQTPSNLSGNTATFATSALTATADGLGHTVSAAYDGDANFLTSTGNLPGFVNSSGNLTRGQLMQYALAGKTCDAMRATRSCNQSTRPG